MIVRFFVAICILLIISRIHAQESFTVGKWERVSETEWRAEISNPKRPPYRVAYIVVTTTETAVLFRRHAPCPLASMQREQIAIWHAEEVFALGTDCDGDLALLDSTIYSTPQFMKSLPNKVLARCRQIRDRVHKRKFHDLANPHIT